MFFAGFCDALSIPNGEVQYNHTGVNGQFPAGTNATYAICDYNYFLTLLSPGSQERYCQSNGQWTYLHEPECRLK